MVFFITSLRHTTVAHNAVIYATVPFIAAGLGVLFLGEKPPKSALAASLFALIGVAVMVGLSVEGGLLGDLLAVAMTVCVALMMVIARRWRDIPTMPAACLSALVSGLFCWPLGDPMAVTGGELWLLAAFGAVNSALGLALFTAAGAALGVALLPRNAEPGDARRRADRLRRRHGAYRRWGAQECGIAATDLGSGIRRTQIRDDRTAAARDRSADDPPRRQLLVL
jgi:hypothetical protein